MSVGVEPCWPQTESVFDRSRILVLQRTRMYDVDTGCQCLVRVPSKERERERARATEREQSQRLDVVLQTAGDWRKQTVVACYGTSRAAPRRAAPRRSDASPPSSQTVAVRFRRPTPTLHYFNLLWICCTIRCTTRGVDPYGTGGTRPPIFGLGGHYHECPLSPSIFLEYYQLLFIHAIFSW